MQNPYGTWRLERPCKATSINKGKRSEKGMTKKLILLIHFRSVYSLLDWPWDQTGVKVYGLPSCTSAPKTELSTAQLAKDRSNRRWWTAFQRSSGGSPWKQYPSLMALSPASYPWRFGDPVSNGKWRKTTSEFLINNRRPKNCDYFIYNLMWI